MQKESNNPFGRLLGNKYQNHENLFHIMSAYGIILRETVPVTKHENVYLLNLQGSCVTINTFQIILLEAMCVL